MVALSSSRMERCEDEEEEEVEEEEAEAKEGVDGGTRNGDDRGDCGGLCVWGSISCCKGKTCPPSSSKHSCAYTYTIHTTYLCCASPPIPVAAWQPS